MQVRDQRAAVSWVGTRRFRESPESTQRARAIGLKEESGQTLGRMRSSPTPAHWSQAAGWVGRATPLFSAVFLPTRQSMEAKPSPSGVS